jgi:glycosyltransferase involved in cell wall biosynthesis
VGGDGMSAPRFSIVTPTFNRAPMLERMLRHLLTVDGILGCELIVIDDGSTDGTAGVLAEFGRDMPDLLHVLTLTNGGPARARNAGVHAACNERILFIDDDVFPRRDMLEQHWQMLESGYDGSQGLLLWHQEIAMDPLIRYIDSRGSQFAFDQIKRPEELGGEHVYTGNFAVRKDVVLGAGGFCESIFDCELPIAAFEDTVLGYAMKKNGARLGFQPLAIADHLHPMTEQAFLKREYNVGSGIAHLQRYFPEITRDLGVDRLGRLLGLQITLLSAVNAVPSLGRVMGYSLRMRLRHRESFLRGYRRYERAYPRTEGA